MNLLTRLARELGAVAKPVDGRLVVVPRGGLRPSPARRCRPS
ncbi:hypothetical protein EMIT0194MI4_10363 [Pseudomonas sp. IT-194MI4]